MVTHQLDDERFVIAADSEENRQFWIAILTASARTQNWTVVGSAEVLLRQEEASQKANAGNKVMAADEEAAKVQAELDAINARAAKHDPSRMLLKLDL